MGLWGLLGLFACCVVLATLAALCMTKSGDVRHEDDVWDLDPPGEGSAKPRD